MNKKATSKLLAGLLLATALLGSSAQAAAPTPITVAIDGKVQQFDPSPLVIQGCTLVPTRALLETLGATVSWDDKTQTITARKGDDVLLLQIGSTTASLNGQGLPLPVAPQWQANRTLVPLRIASEAFGATVTWKEATQTVEIQTAPVPSNKQYAAPPAMSIDLAKSYTAVVKTNKGTFKIHLFDDEAPLTVNNFIFLARDHFYDHVKFHRIIENFVIQTGDPTATGSGGPGYSFQDELPPTKPYAPGIVAMANAGPNTNGSQFFIGTGDNVSYLNNIPNYTVFGEIVEGMDIIKKIAATPVQESRYGEASQPTEDVIIESITIEEE